MAGFSLLKSQNITEYIYKVLFILTLPWFLAIYDTTFPNHVTKEET
jgi:hypothetical protein